MAQWSAPERILTEKCQCEIGQIKNSITIWKREECTMAKTNQSSVHCIWNEKICKLGYMFEIRKWFYLHFCPSTFMIILHRCDRTFHFGRRYADDSGTVLWMRFQMWQWGPDRRSFQTYKKDENSVHGSSVCAVGSNYSFLIFRRILNVSYG